MSEDRMLTSVSLAWNRPRTCLFMSPSMTGKTVKIRNFLKYHQKYFVFGRNKSLEDTFVKIIIVTNPLSLSGWQTFLQEDCHHRNCKVITYESPEFEKQLKNTPADSFVCFDDLSEYYFKLRLPWILESVNVSSHHLRLIVCLSSQIIISTKLNQLLSLVQELHLLTGTSSCVRIFRYLAQRYFTGSKKELFFNATRTATLRGKTTYIAVFLNRPIFEDNRFLIAVNYDGCFDDKEGDPTCVFYDQDTVETVRGATGYGASVNGSPLLKWFHPEDNDVFVLFSLSESCRIIMETLEEMKVDIPNSNAAIQSEQDCVGQFVLFPKDIYKRLYEKLTAMRKIADDKEGTPGADDPEADISRQFAVLQKNLIVKLKLNLPPKKVPQARRLTVGILQCPWIRFPNVYGIVFYLSVNLSDLPETVKDFISHHELDLENDTVNYLDYVYEAVKSAPPSALSGRKKVRFVSSSSRVGLPVERQRPKKKKMDVADKKNVALYKLTTKLLHMNDLPKFIVKNPILQKL